MASLPEGDGGEVTHQAGRRNSVWKTQPQEDDHKKSQIQRLLEFELWKDGDAIKDLEYSRRRTEKKQRRKETKALSSRWWKKLYLPSVLTMLLGSVLTLCAVVRSMSPWLWEAREVLVVVGPVVLALGFLLLMLAAAHTFGHDQEVGEMSWQQVRQGGFQDQLDRVRHRMVPPVRSLSLDTEDFPVPEDLDPSKNYLLPQVGLSAATRRSCRDDSNAGSVGLLGSGHSYTSTASWVQSVAEMHHARPGMLARQNSENNLVAGSGSQRTPAARRFLDDHATTEKLERSGSGLELHVACTQSWTSSGYQSGGGSTASAVEYQVSSEQNAGLVTTYSTSLKHWVGGPQTPAKDCPHKAGPGHVHLVSPAKLALQGPPSRRRHCTVPGLCRPPTATLLNEVAGRRGLRAGGRCRRKSESDGQAAGSGWPRQCGHRDRCSRRPGGHDERCLVHAGGSSPPYPPAPVDACMQLPVRCTDV